MSKKALIPVIAAAALIAYSQPVTGQEQPVPQEQTAVVAEATQNVQTPPQTRWGGTIEAAYDTGMGFYFGLGPRYIFGDIGSINGEAILSPGVFGSSKSEEVTPQGIVINAKTPLSLWGARVTGEVDLGTLAEALEAKVEELAPTLNKYGLDFSLNLDFLQNFGAHIRLGALVANWGDGVNELIFPLSYGVSYTFKPLPIAVGIEYCNVGSDVLEGGNSLALVLEVKF